VFPKHNAVFAHG